MFTPLRTQLRLNMFSGSATAVFSSVTAMASYPIYLHYLGYPTYGRWLVLATVLNVAQFSNLGLAAAVSKLVAEDHPSGNLDRIGTDVATALVALFVSGATAMLVLLHFQTPFVAAFRLAPADAANVFGLLPYIGSLSVYVLLVEVLNSALAGFGRMDLCNYIACSSQLVALIVSACLLVTGAGMASLLIGSAVSYVLRNVWISMALRMTVSFRLRFSEINRRSLTRLLRFGGWVTGESILYLLLSPLNRLVLSRYAGVATVPVYEVAYNGAMKVRSLIETGLRALMPEVSRVASGKTQEAEERLKELNRGAIRVVILGGLPTYVLLLLAAKPALRLWLSTKSEPVLTSAFQLLLCGTFLSLLAVPSYYTLMGTGKVNHCFASALIQSLVNALVIGVAALAGARVSPTLVALGVSAGMGCTCIYLLLINPWSVMKFWTTAHERGSPEVPAGLPAEERI